MPVKIFFCYAHEDEPLLKKLKNNLSPLQRQGLIATWYDRDISGGDVWEEEIKKQLNEAQIILLLVSPVFMASDYINNVEMKRAVERHERGEARVIPVILRPVYWRKAPFGKLQALPTDAKPVTSSKWPSQGEAFFDVAEGIRAAVEELLAKDEAKSWVNQGDIFYVQKQDSEALEAYEQALRLNPNNANAYANKGYALNELQRYQEALEAYEQALRLNPKSASAYKNKGWALYQRKLYQEALAAFKQAIDLDSNTASAFCGMGWALYDLKLYQEALAAFEQAIRLDPHSASAYRGKGWALYQRKLYQEALAAFEQVISLDPHSASAYQGKGIILELLKDSNRG